MGFTMRMYVHPWTAHAWIPFWSMLTLAVQLQANREIWLALVPGTITICFASSQSDNQSGHLTTVHNSRGSMLKLRKDKEGEVRVLYIHSLQV